MAKPIYSETVRSKRGYVVCTLCRLDFPCHGGQCPTGRDYEDHKKTCKGSYTPKKKVTIII